MRNIPFKRTEPPLRPRTPKIVTYDLETTPIAAGTPTPLYFTSYDGKRLVSQPLGSYKKLATVLRGKLFMPENVGAQLVAWNANRYDLRLLLCALVQAMPDFAVQLFTARDEQIRAARFYRVTEPDTGWLLLDGVAMTGARCTLREFLQTFAPDLPKLDVDLSQVEFDPSEETHRAYAERDAIGLWHAINRANKYAQELTGWPLAPTIGRLGMRLLQTRIPHGKKIWRLAKCEDRVIRKYAARGGYTWTACAYRGPMFQYDMNQAYGAAAKYTCLPAGSSWHTNREDDHGRVAFYRCTIARRIRSPIPFYVKNIGGPSGMDGKGVYTHGNDLGTHCWLTNVEVDTLRKHGWFVKIHEGYVWEDSFDLSELIDMLELARSVDPNGPRGEIAKAIGCNITGKTLEVIPTQNYVITSGDPGLGWLPAFPDRPELYSIWCSTEDESIDTERIYHRPQIGAIVTAQVRCWLYDVAMQNAAVVIKIDTDSIATSAPIDVPLHATRYGCWKEQVGGQLSIVVARKSYAIADGRIVASGLNTRSLTWEDFERWFQGTPPVQMQTQLQSWQSANGLGLALFKQQQRTGTAKKLFA